MRVVLEFSPYLVFGRRASHAVQGRVEGPAQMACFNCYIVEDGTLHLRSQGETWLLRPGEACLVDPGCIAWWEAGIVLGRFAFDLVPRPRYLRADGRIAVRDWTPQPSWYELFDQVLPPTIGTRFLNAHRSVLHQLCGASLRSWAHLRANAQVAGLVSDFAFHLSGSHAARPLAEEEPLCRRAEALLSERFGTGMTIADLARLLGYSHEHLARTYKQERGHSLMAFVRSLRLEKAQHQLANHPDRSVREVALSLGLKDHRSLDRLFRQALGCTPGQWRRRVREPLG